jgi:hypothetical protein
MARFVAARSYMSLAVIVVLLILVIGGYIYYHGLFMFGPYAAGRTSARKGGTTSKRKRGTAAADTPAEDALDDSTADPETERLIESINKQ